MQFYLTAVVECAKRYGLELNWSKTKVLKIRSDENILDPDGSPLSCAEQAVYLGALLSTHGTDSKEINRRIGEASA
eukprot:10672072-Karenia_brevis.AAC.1